MTFRFFRGRAGSSGHDDALLQTCWRLRDQADRVLEGGIYRTGGGIEVRVCYSADDVLHRSRVRDVDVARSVAEQWRGQFRAKGFADVLADV